MGKRINHFLSGFLVFQILLQSSVSFANPWINRVQEITGDLDSIQKETEEKGISLNVKRPAYCPTESVTFKNLADKMQAISESLNEPTGKCYQKHAALIGEINLKAREQRGRAPFDTSPSENGSFVENNPQMVINITNNQITNITNNNALVSGLWGLAEDKDCLDLLRQKGQLSVVAEVLTKFGAIGLFVPNTLGVAGSATVLALGGLLRLLDKVIQPAFRWYLPQDRKDFMALTCAFYNVRTQLIEEGFFESKSQNLFALKEPIQALQLALKSTQTELSRFNTEWDEKYSTTLDRILSEKKFDSKKISLYKLIQADLDFLKTEVGAGETPDQRQEVMNRFVRNRDSYQALLSQESVNPTFGAKTYEAVQTFTALTGPDLLRLTRKTFQLGYISTIEKSFNEILTNDLRDIRAVIIAFEKSNDFDPQIPNQALKETIVSKNEELLRKAQGLEKILSKKLQTLARLEISKDLSAGGESASAEYEIYREFFSIKSVVLGKKGWTFFRFLVADAKKHLRVFMRGQKEWEKSVTDPKRLAWNCRNARDLGAHWSAANSAIEFANNYLITNDDLWGETYLKIGLDWGIVPTQSYLDRFVRAKKSIEMVRISAGDPKIESLAQVPTLRSTPFTNFGEWAAKTKGHRLNKDKMDLYLRENCTNF